MSDTSNATWFFQFCVTSLDWKYIRSTSCGEVWVSWVIGTWRRCDGWFVIRDLLALRGATLNIPPFACGKQLASQATTKTRRIARARIRVERAIGRLKQFTILQGIISSGVFRIWQRGVWRARRARAYNGGLGWSPQRGPGAEALVRGSRGRSPPEAETLFAFERSIEAAKLKFAGKRQKTHLFI